MDKQEKARTRGPGRKAIITYIDVAVHRRLRQHALDTDRSLQSLTEEILTEWGDVLLARGGAS